MAEAKTKNVFWRMLDCIRGDKVVWIVVIGLILYSFLAIFGASPQLTFRQDNLSRIDILLRHLKFIAAGVAIMLFIYKCIGTGFIRRASKFGFAVSIALLGFLLIGKMAMKVNGAARAINIINGHGIQVYEYVKVIMILYLSWATDTYSRNNFKTAARLGKKYPIFLKPLVQRIIYIYIPIVAVFLCETKGGFSSAFFLMCIMLATIIAGGVPVKETLILIAVAAILALSSYGIYKVSGGKFMKSRWETAESRFNEFFNPPDQYQLKPGSQEFRDYIDKHGQEEGAKLAISEGGLLGKGPGKSTRNYTVPLIFSDYMFSFIVEEYGLLFGAIPLIILYISLLARGAIIARNCKGNFAQSAVAGICLLISAQAFMHMFINTGMAPTTGQTLPMISHGYNSLIAFCIAFGVLLRISRDAKRNIEIETKLVKSSPIVVPYDTEDEVQNTMADLDNLESQE